MRLSRFHLVATGLSALAVAATVAMSNPTQAAPKPGPALAFTMKDIDGKPVNLADYQGKVVMMVNVASQCGLTPQYAELQALYEKYKGKGFVILGFPANEFGKQEPGTNAEIKEFCNAKYRVTFPMFSKIVVKGEGIDPLYKYLTSATQGKDIEWNFAKFVINRNGEIAARFSPQTKPSAADVVKVIEAELARK